MKTQDIAYVLHRRPYRETSFLVDFFTKQHGVVTAVCRGIRGSKKSRALECFYPFWIEYGHRHHLATLYQWEPVESGIKPLTGVKLYCGFYINELLVKLLGHHDPYHDIFEFYQKVLHQLSQEEEVCNNNSIMRTVEESLRLFELNLLKATGYEIPLAHEANNSLPIVEEKCYYYSPGVGFTSVNSVSSSVQLPVFNGNTILAIARKDFTEPVILKEVKRLVRLTLAVLLEKQEPLKSRALFLKR